MSNHKSAQSNKGDTNDIATILLSFAIALREIDKDRLTKKISPEAESTHRTVEHMKAEAAIYRRIAQETNKARLDELHTLWPKFTDIQLNGTNGPDDNPHAQRVIEERIKALTAEKGQAALQNKTNDGGSDGGL